MEIEANKMWYDFTRRRRLQKHRQIKTPQTDKKFVALILIAFGSNVPLLRKFQTEPSVNLN